MARSAPPVPFPPGLEKEMAMRDWKTWVRRWMDCALVTKLGEQDAAYQAAVCRGCIGAKGLKIYNGRPFKNDTDKDDRALGLL